MEMAKSMGASPEALKKMEAGMKANKEKLPDLLTNRETVESKKSLKVWLP